MKHLRLIFTILAFALCFSKPSFAKIELDWGAFIDADIRIGVDRVDEPRIVWNRSTIGGDLRVDLVPNRLRFVGALDFTWMGRTEDMNFEGLTTRAAVSPWFIDSSAAYVEALDLLPGLDFRVGRQIVHWGTADMFNPTNNLNPLNLEDPLRFGETRANQMIRLDWAIGDNFIITGVWVPVFQPALLPKSGLVALSDPTAKVPYSNPHTRLEVENLRNIWLSNPDAYSIETPAVRATMPDFTLANSQFGLKVLWSMGLFDMSLSYYQGRDDIPVSVKSVSNLGGQTVEEGVTKQIVQTNVTLVYPKKKVVGFDFAGQIPFLDNTGIWFEGAFVFPEQIQMEFDISDVVPGSNIIVDDVVSSQPFFKCTAGLDYSVNQYLFLTGQYVHGFVDEFGAHKIHDYWVAGFDLKFLQDQILVRLFFIGQFPYKDDDLNLDTNGDGKLNSHPSASGARNDGTISSYVIYPQLTFKPVDSLDLTLGGYFLIGHEESKFAMDAAGPSLVFLRTRASF
jgi:hypothetical protein